MKREAFTVILILSAVVFTTTKAKALFDNERYGMKRIVDANPNLIDVKRYGAKGDGKTDDTVAVRNAARNMRPFSTLYFPSGTYLTGPFNLTVSNTQLFLEKDATILGNSRADWPVYNATLFFPQFGHATDCTPGTFACAYARQAIIMAWNVTNLTLRGEGTIDGAGQNWWACAHDLSASPCSGHARPHLLDVFLSSNIRMYDLNIQNSPDWTLHFSGVSDLHVRNVNVVNPSNAPNSDGIDLDCVSGALVEDSVREYLTDSNTTLEHRYFDVGDDALCVKSGIDYFGRMYDRPSRDILFRNIEIGNGHGISVGSETSGGMRNITFQNINMKGTSRGPRIKSERGRGGTIEQIVFRDIVAQDLEMMVSFTLNYDKVPPTNKSATPILRDVTLQNCTFTSSSSKGQKMNAGEFDGLSDSHIEDIKLIDCDFNGGDVTWDKCDFVQGGVCSGFTNSCPPCFETV